jgi:hypothetical protein
MTKRTEHQLAAGKEREENVGSCLVTRVQKTFINMKTNNNPLENVGKLKELER